MKKSKTSKSKISKPVSEDDLAVSSDAEKPGADQFLIVGIGASAGGIQALKTFFENVSADSGAAYVVILHLSPDHDSQLAAVLQAVAAIPVTQVTERVLVEPNHVYVVPPNQHLEMSGGHIVVSEILTVEERRAPVDIFFRTLAESHGERGVAVILSGTGANGSMGVKRLKEKGGVIFVQNPREAEFNEMPRNSIATDLVDLILNVSEIPAQIVAYKNNPGKIEIPAEAEKKPEEQSQPPEEQALLDIFAQLRIRTGHDFTNYKRATILRRIERRINVRELPDITAYSAYLRENTDETTALLKDLLISVTNFFRDKDTFLYLENEVLPKLFDGRTSDGQIRVWVAGCATGEEAYSLAMFLAEQTANAANAPQIQIFATDIDEAAVAKAREGFYTLNDAADVSPDRLKRFFTKEADGYRIRRELRELILFARHNVIKDAPFSRLDLVTCRNMLIYLNHTAQKRVMETFHFSLKAGGYLFLGNSETVDGSGDLYAPVSREHHIYQSRQTAPHIGYPVPDVSSRALQIAAPNPSETASDDERQHDARPLKRISFAGLHQQLLEEYTPSVVISEEHDIVHMSESSLRFMQMSGGEPTQNLLKLIRPELRLELRTALYQAAQRKKNVEAANVRIKIEGREEAVNICVRPVTRQTDSARGYILVLFESVKQTRGKIRDGETVYSSDEPVARQLEEELIRSKAQLRASSEQYEVQAEEFKASNEELQAMNEELRSSSEELETGKEELQSVNEELGTVNQELKIKIEEISQTSNRLHNLINSTDIGTIFLDRLFRVDLFTPAAAQIFNLIPADIGRPLADIAHRLEKTDLLADARLVLDKLQTVEREVRSLDGLDFALRVLPYRTKDDKIGGVVITFYDVTERKQAQELVRVSEERLQRAINIETVGVIFFNNNIEIIDCNEAFVRMSGFTRQELRAGRFSWQAFTPNGFVEVSHRAIEELNTVGISTPYEKEYVRKDGSSFWGLFAAKRIGENEIVEFVTDISEQKRAEASARESEARLRLALDASELGTFVWYPHEDRSETDARTLRLFGLGESDRITLADSLATVIHPDDREFYAHAIAPALDPNGDGKLDVDFRVVHPDESLHWLHIYGHTSFTDEKPARARLMYGMVLDITARKRTESNLAFLAEVSQDLVNLTNVGDTMNRLGAKISAHFNVSRSAFFEFNEPLGDAACEYDWHRADEPSLVGNRRTSDFYTDEFLRVLRAGETFVVSDSDGDSRVNAENLDALNIASYIVIPISRDKQLQFALALYDSAPRDWRADEIELVREITNRIWTRLERARAEEALRESETRLRLAVEAGRLGAWEWNLQTGEVFWNEQHFILFGMPPRSNPLTTDDFFDHLHPDERESVSALLQEAIREKDVFDTDFRIVCDSGEVRWMSGYGRIVEVSANGEPLKMSGLMFDITERKQIEEALSESETRLRLLIESVSDYAIFTLSRDGTIDSWNAGAEKIFGWTESEILGESSAIIFTPEDREKGAPEQEIETALRTGRAPDERFHIRRDDSRFYVSGVTTLLKDAGGEVRGFVKIARDMTEQLAAERALRDKELLQKLVGAQEAERKRIARDLHDELGQQLTALRLKLDAAKKMCEDAEVCGKIDEMELIAKSIDNGVDFLAWELRPAALDDLGLVAALENYVKQWSHHSGVSAELLASSLKRTRFTPEIETNLYRIVQEALNNTHKHAKAKSIEVVLEKRDGLIVLLVEDDGKGFDLKDKKKRRQGMGLVGMNERAQLIGGTLEIESAPGRGTTVFVRVPASVAKRRKSDAK